MTVAQEFHDEGKAEGRVEGKIEALLLVTNEKFGSDPRLQQRIARLSSKKLDLAVPAILKCDNADELVEWLENQ